MLRRILAWILIILFLLLTANLFIFKWALTESVILYGMMIALFFFIKFFDRQGAHYGPADQPYEQDGDSTEEGSEVMYDEASEEASDAGEEGRED